MTGAIIITWGMTVPGREAKSLEIFGSALEYASRLAKEGKIHGHKEYVALTGNSSKFSGTQIMEGEIERLQSLLIEDEFRNLVAMADSVVSNLTVTLAAGGSDQAVAEQVTRYANVLNELGYSG